MRIGVPKEIKNHEYRVGLIPSSVHELIHHGHDVVVQTGAGLGAGLLDEDYLAAGAKLLATADEIFASADMIVKVKEPLAEERKKLRPGQILFTYLHLAPDAPQTQDLIDSGAVCICRREWLVQPLRTENRPTMRKAEIGSRAHAVQPQARRMTSRWRSASSPGTCSAWVSVTRQPAGKAASSSTST